MVGQEQGNGGCVTAGVTMHRAPYAIAGGENLPPFLSDQDKAEGEEI